MKLFFQYLIYIVLLSFYDIHSVFAQEYLPYSITDVHYDSTSDLFYYKKTQDPLNGILSLYYPSKMLRATISFVNGVQEGNSFLYNTYGLRTAKIPYLNGSIHGKTIYYNDLGFVREEITYQSGIKNGLMKRYFPSGKIKQEIPLLRNTIHGTVVLYRENSFILARILYENGRILEGTCYSERGNPQNLSPAELYNWENGKNFFCPDIPQNEY